MAEFLSIAFWSLAAFMVAHYTLTVAEARRVWAIVASVVFAVLFAFFVAASDLTLTR